MYNYANKLQYITWRIKITNKNSKQFKKEEIKDLKKIK